MKWPAKKAPKSKAYTELKTDAARKKEEKMWERWEHAAALNICGLLVGPMGVDECFATVFGSAECADLGHGFKENVEWKVVRFLIRRDIKGLAALTLNQRSTAIAKLCSRHPHHRSFYEYHSVALQDEDYGVNDSKVQAWHEGTVMPAIRRALTPTLYDHLEAAE